MNKILKPSEFQENIYSFVSEGKGNAVVNAKAGSGKTTTAVNAIKLIEQKKKVLYLAFNKSIVYELSQRLKDQTNATVKTFHSLGCSILKENYGYSIKFNQNKYDSKINEMLKKNDFVISYPQIKNDYKKSLKSLLNFARVNYATTEEELEEVAERYNINTFLDVVDNTLELLEWGKDNVSEMDYTDMLWLPCVNNLKTKLYRYNWLFIDEAQDTSIVQQHLIKLCLKKGGRFMAIGDSSQCINGFAGSCITSFENFLNEKNTVKLDLPVSYRCPKKVIKLAQDIVPDIKCPDKAIEGEIKYDTDPFNAKSGDMVLCRMTYPLVKLCIEYLKKGMKSYVKGMDIASNLIEMINETKEDKLSLDFNEMGVFPKLYYKMFTTAQALFCNNDNNIKPDSFGILTSFYTINFYDKIKSLEALSENITTKQQLINKINQIFSDDKDGICLSTIHKAKGLEADNVHILCKSLMPCRYAEKPWQKQEERNIQYVAITRAKKSLSYINEDIFPPHIKENKTDIYKTLSKKIKELKQLSDKLNDSILNENKPEYATR